MLEDELLIHLKLLDILYVVLDIINDNPVVRCVHFGSHSNLDISDISGSNIVSSSVYLVTQLLTHTVRFVLLHLLFQSACSELLLHPVCLCLSTCAEVLVVCVCYRCECLWSPTVERQQVCFTAADGFACVRVELDRVVSHWDG